MKLLPSTVYNDSHQVVHAVGVGGVPGRVEEAELQGEDNTIGQFGVAVQLVHVFKALQVEGEDHRELLHPHPDGDRKEEGLWWFEVGMWTTQQQRKGHQEVDSRSEKRAKSFPRWRPFSSRPPTREQEVYFRPPH